MLRRSDESFTVDVEGKQELCLTRFDGPDESDVMLGTPSKKKSAQAAQPRRTEHRGVLADGFTVYLLRSLSHFFLGESGDR